MDIDWKNYEALAKRGAWNMRDEDTGRDTVLAFLVKVYLGDAPMIEQYDPRKGALLPWLLRRFAWYCIDEQRLRRPSYVDPESLPDPIFEKLTTDYGTRAGDLQLEAKRFIGSLADALLREDQIIIELHVEGYSIAEIALKVGCKEEAAKKRRFRALAKVRAVWDALQ